MTDDPSHDVQSKKKSRFTFTDWIEGAVLLFTAIAFVVWLVT
ncbi:hypothetical protein [Streptomyces chattanoogensis]|nr:hypothetical protein [Streptomyces chattanoogensis]